MNMRRLHRKLSLYIFLPLGVIVVSGVFLQFRNQFEWIQPELIVGEKSSEQMLHPQEIMKKLELKENQIDQMIYKPSKNNIALRLKSGEEIQVHPVTGTILKRAIRRTNLLIDIHQGSIIGPLGQYGIYIITGFGMIILYISGINLLLPRRKK